MKKLRDIASEIVFWSVSIPLVLLIFAVLFFFEVISSGHEFSKHVARRAKEAFHK